MPYTFPKMFPASSPSGVRARKVAPKRSRRASKAEKIDNRVSTFQQETGTDKNILVTLITVKPVKENAWTDTVSSFVTLQDLLG